MKFLSNVSRDIIARYGTNLSRVAVVFPNKRARLFFNKCLIESNGGQNLWAPTYFTIEELFASLSSLRVVDPIKAVCRLYDIYEPATRDIRHEFGYHTSLDTFYGWGEQLLSDFSDVDASLCDAHNLFCNLEAARQLELFDQEQMEQLQPLIRLLSTGDATSASVLRREFQMLWSRLEYIYTAFNERLEAEGEATQGHLCREVIERLQAGRITLSQRYDVYAFVGFNFLQPVQRQLFRFIQSEGKACFYWDYDVLYCGHTATLNFGDTLADDMRRCPNALTDATLFDNLRHHAPFRFVASQSNKAQSIYAGKWLEDRRRLYPTDEESAFAVVLCDENMLEQTIHNIPDNLGSVNITKGFPLSHTVVYHAVDARLRTTLNKIPNDAPLPTSDENADFLQHLADGVCRHAQEEAAERPVNSCDWVDVLNTEASFECFTLLGRLSALCREGILNVSFATLCRLVRQLLAQATIPFKGEPAGGIQVMGMLETRNLEFRHLLLLGANEGILPRRAVDRSFIPYDLRKHFNIMTTDERNAVYAHNFFRLLARSEDVSIVYNNSTDGDRRTGEMSRFMLQMQALTDIQIEHYALHQTNRTEHPAGKTTEAPKASDVLTGDLKFSPTALSDYVKCPLRYFFANVARLQTTQEFGDILASNVFGSIFHKAAELIYAPSKGRPIDASALRELAGDEAALTHIVLRAFDDVNAEERKRNPGYTDIGAADHELERNVIVRYLQMLLRYDAQSAAKAGGLIVDDVEQKMKVPFTDATNTPEAQIYLTGSIDRVDTLGGVHRIADYKTGGYDEKKMKAENIDSLFVNPDSGYVLQTLCYALMYRLATGKTAEPALLFTSKLANNEHSPYTTLSDQPNTPLSQRVDEFEAALRRFIQHIETSPFTPRPYDFSCRYCNYTLLCGVKKPNK